MDASEPVGSTPDQVARRAQAIEQWLGRRRLERTLHDGASLRISALALRVGLLGQHDIRIDSERERWRAGLDRVQDELHATLQELRAIAAEIYPPLLDQAGLGPALRELAGQRGLDLTVRVGAERFGPAAEGAAYFALVDWLDSRPDDAGPAHVTVTREGLGDHAELVVSMSPVSAGHHVLLSVRADPLGGRVTPVPAPPGHLTGTTLMMRIPCE